MIEPIPFEEKRLAKLFRQAALAHIRREYSRALEILDETEALLEWAQREDWAPGVAFISQWRLAVRKEKEGVTLDAAPAAWIHLSQELASILDSKGNWISYLGSRWVLDQGRVPVSRRTFYGFLSVLSLGLATMIVVLIGRALVSGHYDMLMENPFRNGGMAALLLMIGRVAGIVMMLEHGVHWGRKALFGRAEIETVTFLAGGLTVVE